MRLIAAGLLLAAAPVAAAERSIGVTGFDRVRIETSLTVRITTGGSPGARLSGDPAALDGVALRQNGTTVTVARSGGARGAVTLVLTTPVLSAVSLDSSGSVAVDRMKGTRVDLSLAGSGTMTVDRIEADQLSAMLIGDGTLTVTGGKVRTARLIASGAGAIDTAGVESDSLFLRRDGVGPARAQARYTADVANTGTGEVTVAGNARCTIRASSGAVACGQGAAARP